MGFTGKATYAAGASLPESAEDVSDLVAINSPHETPLLDALGDASRVARSTLHEWLQDSLLPNTDTCVSFETGSATMTVGNVDAYRVGDQIVVAGTDDEVMLVDAVDTEGGTIHVVRGYGGTSSTSDVDDDSAVTIVGNASLEGADAAAARF